jgi:hypothetical protein
VSGDWDPKNAYQRKQIRWMQTFLPHPNYRRSLECLDRQRLGKQRVEALQLLNALSGFSKSGKDGWKNHPAALMWRRSEFALLDYGLTACEVWVSRGYKDTCAEQMTTLGATMLEGLFYRDSKYPRWGYRQPPWLGDARFHRSHRSNLLRKNPDHYAQFNWNVPDDLPYIWPVRLAKAGTAATA